MRNLLNVMNVTNVLLNAVIYSLIKEFIQVKKHIHVIHAANHFPLKGILVIIKKIHTGEDCDKSFYQAGALTTQKIIHTGEKP